MKGWMEVGWIYLAVRREDKKRNEKERKGEAEKGGEGKHVLTDGTGRVLCVLVGRV